jgi:ParB-like chromosome segregation protein Spo0J
MPAPNPEKATGGSGCAGPPFLPEWVGRQEGVSVRADDNATMRPLAVTELGERYRRYRLADASAEAAMARSLCQYGQLAPVTACWRDGRAELLDGFKRQTAAAQVGWPTLHVRVLEVDERAAKAAIFGLNCVGRRPQELEEAWIVQALVREDGLSQVEVATLLDRHKSWVCRRLALLERLGTAAQAELRLGLLSSSLARQLTRLPTGNQETVLTVARRQSLTVLEVQGVIDLLRGATPEQEALLLQDPRAALQQAAGVPPPARDPRLSPAGNRLARQRGLLLDLLGRLENWQRHPGLAELKRDDRRLLAPQFTRLARDARAVANLVADLWLAPFQEQAS